MTATDLLELPESQPAPRVWDIWSNADNSSVYLQGRYDESTPHVWAELDPRMIFWRSPQLLNSAEVLIQAAGVRAPSCSIRKIWKGFLPNRQHGVCSEHRDTWNHWHLNECLLQHNLFFSGLCFKLLHHLSLISEWEPRKANKAHAAFFSEISHVAGSWW